MRELKLTQQNKITLGKNLHAMTHDDWVTVLRSAERNTAQSILMSCYAWHQMKLNCEEQGDAMKDICEELGVSPSGASERALIGSRAQELMPFVDKLPSGMMAMYEMCKIDKDNEQVKKLLQADIITPAHTRDQMKKLVKAGVSARSSAVFQGDMVEYIKAHGVEHKDNVTLDEDGNVVEPEKKPTGGKKAKEQVAEQATHKQLEADAAKQKLKDYEHCVDQLVNMILVPDVLAEVCAVLTSHAQDNKDAVEMGKIERIFETISEFAENEE